MASSTPEVVHVIVVDFNHADLKLVFPQFDQHINCATRGLNTVDKPYLNIKNSYRLVSKAHLRHSDHMSVFLQDCFEGTN